MDLKTTTDRAPRVNGAPPAEIPLADIALGSLDFWALDDDYRDGAIHLVKATRLCQASFHG